MISITVSSSDRLHLNQAEAGRLAEAVRQELVCRTVAQADEPVMVADICLTVAEAWRLLDRIEGWLNEEKINWAVEGF